MTATHMAAAIESAREAAHMSRRALEDRTGISESTLRRILSGRRTVKMTEIIQIADALGCTAAQLTGTAIADRVQCAPAGFALRHTGRDRGDLTIRLVRELEHSQPASRPIDVPQAGAEISADVRALAESVSVAVTDAAMERALRILQAIVNECRERQWSVQADPRDARRFRITTGERVFEFSLVEEFVGADVLDNDALASARYPWQRVPLRVKQVGSGRLSVKLRDYVRNKSWSDRSRWSLEDKLGALFVELDARYTEAIDARKRREADLLCRQEKWDAAVMTTVTAITATSATAPRIHLPTPLFFGGPGAGHDCCGPHCPPPTPV